MNRPLNAGFAAVVTVTAATAMAALGGSRVARADETSVDNDEPAPLLPMAAEEPGYTGPNRVLIATGLIAFSGAYVPSVIVGTVSPRPVDQRLYIPVAGPWIDLAERPGCGANHFACDRETTDKAWIVVSGTFQGAGALLTLASFAFPERDGYVTTAKRDERDKAVEKAAATRALKPTLHFGPTRLGAAGYGVVAFGGF
jgi:hypothetical protein